MSSSVMPSSTPRTLARTATQVSRSRIVDPWYSMSSGACPATEPSGPSTARITSATVILSAGLASAWPPSGPRWLATIPARRSSSRMFWRNFCGMPCASASRSAVTGEPSPDAASSTSARIA